MVWHQRPGGVSAFPSGTAAQWATANFTPITATSLNNLIDNLNFLRNPPILNLSTTPGTVTSTTNPAVSVSVFSGTLVGFSKGKLYINLHVDFLRPTTATPAGVSLSLNPVSGSNQFVTPALGLSTSSSMVIYQFPRAADAAGTYYSHSIIGIIDASFMAAGNLGVSMQLLGNGSANVSIKNARLSLREL